MQVSGIALVAPIPATFIGLLKFAAEKVQGHSYLEAAKFGLAFLLLTYISIIVAGSVFAIATLKKKLDLIGVPFSYLGSLSAQERRTFEKNHGL